MKLMIMIRIMEEMWKESWGNGYSMLFNWVRKNDNDEELDSTWEK